jgi:broad specificity phosphatase PhoE
MRRRIYLVRHGQTEANALDTVQTPDDPLTEKGIAQAETLAGRFQTLQFDTLVSSDLPRAIDTALIIAQRLNYDLLQSPLLREMSYSNDLFGMARSGSEVADYYRQKMEHLDDADWHWGDEESFTAAHSRVKEAFAYLESLPGTVVAVAHGHFIRFMVVHLLLGADMRPREAHRAMYSLLTNNTAITVLEERDGRWHLLTWNDHAHLG